jgi:prevent-host-death family protein
VKQVNIHQAKTTLSQLIREAEAGEDVVIARAGKPAVRLVPVPEFASAPKVDRSKLFGLFKGQIWVAPDFDDPDPELERLFYDGPIFPEDEGSAGA